MVAYFKRLRPALSCRLLILVIKVQGIASIAISKLITAFFPDPAEFSDDDLENIEHLIEEGRKQGLEKLDITINKDLGSSFEVSAGIPIDGAAHNAKIELKKTNKGDYVIKVDYKEISYTAEVEAPQKYAQLNKDGIITDEEFKNKKKEILRV